MIDLPIEPDSKTSAIVGNSGRRWNLWFVGIWLAATTSLTAYLWFNAFHIEYSWVHFHWGDEFLVRYSSEEEGQLDRDLFRLRVSVSAALILLLFLVAGAVAIFMKWKLSRWLTSDAKPAILGGWLIFLMVWGVITSRLPIPDSIEISFWVWILLMTITFALLLVSVVGALHLTEGRAGFVATGVRGVILVLSYAAGAFALLAVVAIMLIKGLALLMGI